jgi:hypothetical protein
MLHRVSPTTYCRQIVQLSQAGYSKEELATKLNRPLHWIECALDFAGLPEEEHWAFDIFMMGIEDEDGMPFVVRWLHKYKEAQRIMRF